VVAGSAVSTTAGSVGSVCATATAGTVVTITSSTTSSEEEEETGPAQSSLATRKHASLASESQSPVAEQSFEGSTHLTLASMKLVAQTLRTGEIAGATASSAATAAASSATTAGEVAGATASSAATASASFSGQYSTGKLQQNSPLGQSPFTHSS